MPQYLKEDVRQRIDQAALETFAQEGFGRATMAEIARRAGISTGNVYRYYRSKKVLFDAVLPQRVADELRELLRRRSSALAGVDDYRTLPDTSEYSVLARLTLDFAVENRLRLVILLGRAEGTRYEGFVDEVVAELVELAIGHFRSQSSASTPDRTMRFGLDEIYRNFVGTLVHILEHFRRPDQIRDAVERVSRYHRVGLKSFFA